jgi:hypothetical protein
VNYDRRRARTDIRQDGQEWAFGDGHSLCVEQVNLEEGLKVCGVRVYGLPTSVV